MPQQIALQQALKQHNIMPATSLPPGLAPMQNQQVLRTAPPVVPPAAQQAPAMARQPFFQFQPQPAFAVPPSVSLSRSAGASPSLNPYSVVQPSTQPAMQALQHPLPGESQLRLPYLPWVIVGWGYRWRTTSPCAASASDQGAFESKRFASGEFFGCVGRPRGIKKSCAIRDECRRVARPYPTLTLLALTNAGPLSWRTRRNDSKRLWLSSKWSAIVRRERPIRTKR